MWGTQFHPEKSGTVGLGILANFVAAVGRPTADLMDLYPAIDIRDGGAVRLTQGDFDRQTDYGDPVDLARRFAAAGAPWLHVVDLDAARTGRPVNRATVAGHRRGRGCARPDRGRGAHRSTTSPSC